MRKLVVTATVVLSALTASACATAGASPPARDPPNKLNGVYRTHVHDGFQSGALNGVWTLRLDNGAYTFNYAGKTSKNVIVSGLYAITGRQITFRDHSAACSAKPGSAGCRYLGCRKPATYTFKLTGKELAFTRLRDRNTNCELPIVLASVFRRVH